MVICRTTADIDAPAQRVWNALAAVDAWPQWLPTVRSVEALDGMPLEVGKRFRVTQPKLRPAVWVVEVVEPGRRFLWRVRSPGMRMTGDHVVESAGPSAARAILGFAFEGIVGVLLGKLYGPLTRGYIEQEARALKAVAEATD
ncbi:MAG TPA: SRPBCC family protein [Rhodanobacteraceae bacterium]|jgi:uncharacterized membrane protein|nr:SRPBCC family protein [Rhodanobacteraceae bacterium]